jgi:hypothetical protein
MLEFKAHQFMNLAREIEQQDSVFFIVQAENESAVEFNQVPKAKLDQGEIADLTKRVGYMADLAADLELSTSKTLLDSRKSAPPTTLGEWRMLIESIHAELKSKLFLFVPSHRAKFFKIQLPEAVFTGFPFASREIQDAGRCISAGQWTASVFHSMRAGEIGVRALSDTLSVTLPIPSELADWHTHQMQIASKILAIKNSPKSEQRDKDLGFYSQAAAQLQYFNDGWRVRVAHSRATYDEGQAISVLVHTISLIEKLAERVKEPGV